MTVKKYIEGLKKCLPYHDHGNGNHISLSTFSYVMILSEGSAEPYHMVT